MSLKNELRIYSMGGGGGGEDPDYNNILNIHLEP